MKCYYARNTKLKGHVKCTLQAIVEDVVHEHTCDNHCPFKKSQMRGLGDLIERILTWFGITKKRYAAVTRRSGDCSACNQRQDDANDFIEFDENGWPRLVGKKTSDNSQPEQLH
jgi:hypothetical protein